MKTKTSILLFSSLVFSALAFLSAGCACKSTWKGDPPPQPIKIACIGDSLTFGMNIENRASSNYPAHLSRLAGSGFEVEGFAVSGMMALKNVPGRSFWDLPEFTNALAWNPEIVVICFGANDCWPDIWKDHKDEFKPDLAAMANKFKDLPSKPAVWLASPTPMGIPADRFPGNVQLKILSDEIVPAVRDVAKETGSGYIDFFNELSGNRVWFQIDKVHPTAAGSAKMAEVVWTAINPGN